MVKEWTLTTGKLPKDDYPEIVLLELSSNDSKCVKGL